MSATAMHGMTIKLKWDGKKFVPQEPVDLELGTEIVVVVDEHGPTWAEKKFGLPRLVPKRGAPSSEDIIHEARGEY